MALNGAGGILLLLKACKLQRALNAALENHIIRLSQANMLQIFQRALHSYQLTAYTSFRRSHSRLHRPTQHITAQFSSVQLISARPTPPTAHAVIYIHYPPYQLTGLSTSYFTFQFNDRADDVNMHVDVDNDFGSNQFPVQLLMPPIRLYVQERDGNSESIQKKIS